MIKKKGKNMGMAEDMGVVIQGKKHEGKTFEKQCKA